MNKRAFLLSATMLMSSLGALSLPTSAFAQDAAPLVKKAKIIEALTAKDIVLDTPANQQRTQRTPSERRGAVIDLYVQFTFDSAELLPAGKRQLDELAMALSDQSLADASFLLAGHTDKVGDADYNIKLSMMRAQSVRTYLAQAHGLPESRLRTIGYGYSRLLDPANPKAAINRRVEVRRLAASAAEPTPDLPSAYSHPRLVPTP